MKKKFLAVAMVVALVSALVVPATVLAQPPDTTEISGQLDELLELTAPGDIDLGKLIRGWHSGYGSGNVRASLNWSLTVTASHVTMIDGKEYAQMSLLNHGVHRLTKPLLTGAAYLAEGGSLGEYLEDLKQLEGYGRPGEFGIPLRVRQEITGGDRTLPAGSYSVVLTYTASPEV